jgi:hypothetical protein
MRRSGRKTVKDENVYNRLSISILHFSLIFQKETRLPQFIGNTIRGALGQSLHENVANAYNAVFKVSRSDSVPNPFVISAPYPSKCVYKPGDSLKFDITLFGAACDYADDIIAAAILMGKGKFADTEIDLIGSEPFLEWSDTGAEAIPSCSKITLDFITPTTLLSGGKPIYAPDFALLLDSLFGRISAIIDNYGESEFIVPYSLFAKKPFIKTEYDLKQVRINSNSQPINGFTGKVKFCGDVTRYLPYIDLGSQLHIGKKTTRSCGEYIFKMEEFAQ